MNEHNLSGIEELDQHFFNHYCDYLVSKFGRNNPDYCPFTNTGNKKTGNYGEGYDSVRQCKQFIEYYKEKYSDRFEAIKACHIIDNKKTLFTQ